MLIALSFFDGCGSLLLLWKTRIEPPRIEFRSKSALCFMRQRKSQCSPNSCKSNRGILLQEMTSDGHGRENGSLGSLSPLIDHVIVCNSLTYFHTFS